MAIITYSSNKLSDMNKTGKLKKDGDGYYTVPLGALNVINSAGEFYRLSGSDELFKESSMFMKAVEDKAIYSENGHPSRKNRSKQEYVQRLLNINQEKITNHVQDVWLDDTLYKQHPDLLQPKAVAIMGKIKPYGNKEKVCSDAISNPHQNLCYSIRSFTDNKQIGGRTVKTLKHVVTFDLVYLGGIAIASKYNSPTLESVCTLGQDDEIVSWLENIVDNKEDEISLEHSNRAAQVLESLHSTSESSIIMDWYHKK